MAAVYQDFQRVFLDPNHIEQRISTFYSLYLNVKNKVSKGFFQKDTLQYELAEAMVHVAIVISSHLNGLENTTIRDFLRALVCELDLHSPDDMFKSPSMLPLIDLTQLGEDVPRVSEKMPYLSSIDQLWNDDFISFIRTMYPAMKFGTANYPSKANDLFINDNNSIIIDDDNYTGNENDIPTDLEEPHAFMCVEFKCHNNTTSTNQVLKFANKLLANPGSFFVLVVRKITPDNEARPRNSPKKKTKPNKKRKIQVHRDKIFMLKKNEDGFFFVPIPRENNVGQKNNAQKETILFVIDFATIYTENTNAKFEDTWGDLNRV